MKSLLIPMLPAIILAACSPKYEISVDTGGHDRDGCIVSVTLDKPCPHYILTDGNGEEVPCQIISQGGEDVLYFNLDGPNPAGHTRSFIFRKGKTGRTDLRRMDYVLGKDGDITLGGPHGTILKYNGAVTPAPEGVSSLYARSGYIHPACTPSGFVYTNIQPEDHRHHYGIWNPWTKVEYDGNIYDLWNLGDSLGTVRATGIRSTDAGLILCGFDATLDHVAFTPGSETVIMKEGWSVLAADTKDGYVWDFESVLSPCTDKTVTIKAYRYQGFSCRATAEWTKENSVMMTSEGLERPEIDQTRANWIYVNGANGEETAGFMFLSCPDNYDSPEQLRIWDQNANWGRGDVYVNFCPAKSVDWVLEPGHTYHLKYRVIAYDGEMTPEKAAKLWTDYACPPAVTIKQLQ